MLELIEKKGDIMKKVQNKQVNKNLLFFGLGFVCIVAIVGLVLNLSGSNATGAAIKVEYYGASEKLMEKTGWKPNSNFKEAIKETVNWYLKNELWWRPISSEQVLHPSSWKLKW